MKRRNFTGLLATAVVGAVAHPILAKKEDDSEMEYVQKAIKDTGLPEELPENIKQLIKNVTKQNFKDVNTDWFGSIQIEGLLRFSKRGYKEGLDYAINWFNYHVEHDGKLTDEEYYAQYDGNRARILREGPLTFVIYSANLGVAFPVHELYKQTKNPVAKRVCMDVADAVLHYAGRDRFGMLAHDDTNFEKFAIPDTAYWATRSNAIAAKLSQGAVADVYWKQSIYQLSQGIKYFFDTEKGIVRTGLFMSEPGTTYWCRSQAWLIWAIGGLLRYLPKDHSYYKEACEAMKAIADGVKKYQSPNGALHVLVDDPSSPEEVTGIAMVIATVKEGMREGWIPDNYNEMCKKAWTFIQKSVDDKGIVHNAYTGWAVPAEEKKVNRMDEKFLGFVPGVIMLAADEMTR